jgi:large subunit ribosomal protein L4
VAETAPVFSSYGTKREPVALPAELFDGTVNMPVMHQAVKAYLANQRQGNAKTKTRGLVAGGNQKPWKQKGTGRARQGSIRAPNWVGGGTVFGPIPRSYAEYVPRQVRALARKSAFNARANEGGIIVIDAFSYDAPSTKRLVALLASLGVSDKKVLILTDGVKHNVFLSGRNLPTAHVMPYSDVSTYHLLWSDVVLIESSAFGYTIEPLSEKAPELKSRTRPEAAPKAPAKVKAKVKATKKAAAAESEAPKAPAKKKTAAKKDAAKRGAKASSAAPKAQAKTQKSKSKTSPKTSAKKAAPKKGGGKSQRGR